MVKKPAEQVKSEYIGIRMTRSEKRDLEKLMKRLGRNKTDALKYALGIALQSLPPAEPRQQAAA